MQQRKHRLDDTNGAEEVRIENFLHHAQIGRARQSIPAQVDARVVHQNIEAAVPTLNLLRGGCNGVLPRNVDLNKVNITESGLPELPDGLLTSLHVTRTQQHGASSAAEITRDFQAYAFIPSGHQCDPLLQLSCELKSSCCDY